MIISNWPAAIAHIDADCFYASCERLRRPDLAGRPLCVLSSQDACVVAKTYDAKAAGISTGMPVWEAKKRLPEAVFLPADFRFYGLISNKMFAVLHRYSPQVEHYSIDEGFADLDGLRGYWRMGYGEIGDAMRRSIREEIGITASIGVSVTRTLAKMASEANKPDGLAVVPGRHIAAFLAGRKAADIPGIGSRRTALLAKFNIHTALQFARAPESLIRRLLGRGGLDLWRELNGISLFGIQTEAPLPKSMARTASLGKRTRDVRLLRAHLSHHCFRLAMDLVARSLAAKRLTLVLRLGNFDRIGHSVPLPAPTQHLGRIQQAARAALQQLLRPDMEFSGCGIIAGDIEPAGRRQQSLFAPGRDEERALPLWQAMQEARSRFGRDIIRPAATLARSARPEPHGRRFGYPLIVCK